MVMRHENIPTVAIIVYNGKRLWNPSNIPMYPNYPEYYHQIKLPFICEFIDVGETFNEKDFAEIDNVTAYALLLMKYIFEPKQLKKHYSAARDALLSIPKEECTRLIQQTLVYLTKYTKTEERAEFMDYVTFKDVFSEPSLYDVLEEEYINAHKDEWKAEGVAEGKAEGRLEGKKNAIVENC